MKYAVISDIHSNYISLMQAISDALSKNIDKFIFLGDYITDGIYDNEVLEVVKKYGTYVISGNREQYLCGFMQNGNFSSDYNNEKPLFYSLNHLSDENRKYIQTLPKHFIFEVEGKTVLLLHGNNPFIVNPYHSESLKKILSMYDFSLCLYGHLHEVQDFVYQNHRFLNPGSVGIPADGPSYSYGILTIADTVDFEIVRFSTHEFFSKLRIVYEKSDYYKENKVWCELILKSIYEGKDVVAPFIEKINDKLHLHKQVDVSLYNTLWDQVYEELKDKEEM